MKASFKFLLPALVLLLPACQREMNAPEVDPMPEGPVSIDVTIDQATTRTAVSELTGAITFSMGDRIAISDGLNVFRGITSSTSTTGTFVMEEGFDPSVFQDYEILATFAGFPASMVAEIDMDYYNGILFTLPASYTFGQVGGKDFNMAKVPCPMTGLYRFGGGISLKPVCSLVRFYLTNVVAGTLTITFPTDVTGEAWLSPASEAEMNEALLDPISSPTEILASELIGSGNTVTITGVPTTEGDEFLCITLPVPVGTIPQNISVRNTPTDTSVKQSVAFVAGSSEALERGHGQRLQNINLTSPSFSISNNKRVIFAPGNLQYIGSVSFPYWKFAEHQWDFLGSTTNQDTDATNVDRDLFGWGTGTDPNKVSTSNDDYSPFKDWGNNTIVNGGGYSWRTLYHYEWQYLFDGRSGSPKYAMAKVADKKGLILFPDDYVHPSGIMALNNVDNDEGEFDDNVFDVSSWSLMEQSGCVFLPAAGYRYGTGEHAVFTVGGHYWSSVRNGSTAYSLVFSNAGVRPNDSNSRFYGYSVRLVRDVE